MDISRYDGFATNRTLFVIYFIHKIFIINYLQNNNIIIFSAWYSIWSTLLTIIINMNSVKVISFGSTIHTRREALRMPLRKVAALIDIDQAVLSKIEHGHRKADRKIIKPIAEALQLECNSLLRIWLADNVIHLLAGEEQAYQVLDLANRSILALRNDQNVGLSDFTPKVDLPRAVMGSTLKWVQEEGI
jgi:HTH-type transcriptional regulator, competence development regulator